MMTPKKANAGAYLAAAGQAKEVAPKSVDALDERIANVVAGPKYSDEKLFAEKGAKMSDGGTTTIDDSGSNVPSDLVDVFNQFDEDADSYGEMERLRLKANDLGYDFDYDLGGGPTEFWKLKNGGYILKQSHLSSAQYQDAKKLKNFDKKD